MTAQPSPGPAGGLPAGLPDIIAPGLSVLFCGINPAATAAVSGHHFSNRSNRFWRVLHLAGFTPLELAAADDRAILSYGYGLTAAVSRPTAAAHELSAAELFAAAEPLALKVRTYRPQRLAFLGKQAFAAIAAQRQVAWGPQPARFAGAEVWVLPNPSGRNLNFSLDALVLAYRDLRLAVG